VGWTGNVACVGDRRGSYRVLVLTADGRRPFGRPMRRYEDNIKMGNRKVGWTGLMWLAVGTGGGRL
jgi:hypothetical protein